MRIEYTCEDGSRTLVLWPSMALQHWLGRSRPTRPIENPEARSEVVYVGDSLRCDVLGAKAAGLATVWINPEGGATPTLTWWCRACSTWPERWGGGRG